MTKKTQPLPKPTWPELREMSVKWSVDPRTILEEWANPGEGTSMARTRARNALAAWEEAIR